MAKGIKKFDNPIGIVPLKDNNIAPVKFNFSVLGNGKTIVDLRLGDKTGDFLEFFKAKNGFIAGHGDALKPNQKYLFVHTDDGRMIATSYLKRDHDAITSGTSGHRMIGGSNKSYMAGEIGFNEQGHIDFLIPQSRIFKPSRKQADAWLKWIQHDQGITVTPEAMKHYEDWWDNMVPLRQDQLKPIPDSVIFDPNGSQKYY